MRILPERADHDGEGDAGQDSASDGRADPRNDEHDVVPVHDILSRSNCDQARGENDSRSARRIGKGRRGMTGSSEIPKRLEEILSTHRRGFLKSAGLLAVSFVTGDAVIPEAEAQSGGAGPYHDPDFRQLDSWIVIHEDNTATFYVGKTDCGQGTGTSFRQLMS